MEPDLDSLDIKFGTGPLDKDPEPKSKAVREPRKSAPRKTAGRPTKQSNIKELQDEVLGLMMMIAMPLAMRDHHEDGSSCADMFFSPGTGFTKEAVEWSEAFATIGVDNKFIKGFFEMGDKAGKWTKLAFATLPFVQGFASNHSIGRGNHGPRNSSVETAGA